MTEPCRFCDIANYRAEGYVVLEDQETMAFLDRRPLFPGHCLLIPKRHLGTLEELPAEYVGRFFRNSQILAQAVQSALEADGSFVALNNRVSQSVPHVHLHVVPRRYKDGLRGFFWPRSSYRDQQHLLDTQRALAEAVERIRSSGY